MFAEKAPKENKINKFIKFFKVRYKNEIALGDVQTLTKLMRLLHSL